MPVELPHKMTFIKLTILAQALLVNAKEQYEGMRTERAMSAIWVQYLCRPFPSLH